MRLNLISIMFFSNFLVFSQQIAPIQKIDFENSSFNSLSFLKNELSDVKIVGLGESLHIMGATYTSKVKFIKYLHENCGFDVIAFEAPLYDLGNMNEKIIKNETNIDEIAQNNSGVWNFKEVYELYEYIIESQKTSHPLILTGFDESIYYFNDKRFNKDFDKFIDNLNVKTGSSIQLDSVFDNALSLTIQKCFYFSKIPVSDTLALSEKIKEIRNNISLNKTILDDNYYKYWDLMMNNIQSIYRKNYNLSNREFNMYNNLKFLINDVYPDKKIIIWAATYHLLYEEQLISEINNKNKEKIFGEYLRENFKDQYYSVFFTPFSGTTGFSGYMGLGKKKIKTNNQSLEKYIDKTYHCDYAFVSNKSNTEDDIYSENNLNYSNIIGGKPYKMDLSKTSDAYFYIKTEKLVQK